MVVCVGYILVVILVGWIRKENYLVNWLIGWKMIYFLDGGVIDWNNG